jgi:hypothetical protein
VTRGTPSRAEFASARIEILRILTNADSVEGHLDGLPLLGGTEHSRASQLGSTNERGKRSKDAVQTEAVNRSEEETLALTKSEATQADRELSHGVVAICDAGHTPRGHDFAVKQVRDLQDDRVGLSAPRAGKNDGVVVVFNSSPLLGINALQ